MRNVLQQDLQGATCPGETWQRPESNHGYIELIEGPYREGNASRLVDGEGLPDTPDNPEIDHATSILPSSNIFPFINPESGVQEDGWATDGGGLGDYDDILMLTTRNESKPFVGRAPANIAGQGFNNWGTPQNIESPLAEVIWFAIENPEPASNANNFTGEPGMRTIYRRTLLIAPWLNPYRSFHPRSGAPVDTFQCEGGNFKAEPGLVRIISGNVKAPDVDAAIAAVIAFQDRYDLSVRLEWDYNIGRWKIMANTLGDLTKRENRYGHYGFFVGTGASNPSRRVYPYPLVSIGAGYSGSSADVTFVADVEVGGPSDDAKATANIAGGAAVSYLIDSPMNYTEPNRRYTVRPFAFVDKDASVPATAQAVLNRDGAVVRVLHGPVPLWGTRQGEDVMLTNVLGFDVRAFDPGAPIFRHAATDTMLTPTDPGWTAAYTSGDNMSGGFSAIGRNNTATGVEFPYIGQGAYVDLGYGYDLRLATPGLPAPSYAAAYSSSASPWFFTARALSDVYLSSRTGAQQAFSQLAPGYSVYDTWSFHYENNGANEDQLRHDGSAWVSVDTTVDEGTDGLDGPGNYSDAYNVARLGVDDVGERETVPPYDKPLRGVQVQIRTYEPDSRAIRQVRVNQHFMPE
jgi:hypothetical protein